MPEGYLFKEKRVHPRISVKIPVLYRMVENAQEVEGSLAARKKESQARTMDISLGGISIVVPETLIDGALLQLYILLPDPEIQLKALAKVVWASETGGGLRFLSMNEEDVKSLKAYLDKASSR